MIDLCELAEKPVPAFLAVGFSQDCTTYDVIGVAGQELAHVHRRASGGRRTDLVDNKTHLHAAVDRRVR